MSSVSLIVVSNRLPFVVSKLSDGTFHRKPSAGGLVTAVAPVVVQCKGLWVGWPGPNLPQRLPVPEADPYDRSPTSGLQSSQIVSVELTDQDFQLYYNGCCNATFWPLFHSMLERTVFQEQFWNNYKNVNNNFAEATLGALRHEAEGGNNDVPIVWIQDYHLMLVAARLRQENLPCKIGFFLHIPFPHWDILRYI